MYFLVTLMFALKSTLFIQVLFTPADQSSINSVMVNVANEAEGAREVGRGNAEKEELEGKGENDGGGKESNKEIKTEGRKK